MIDKPKSDDHDLNSKSQEDKPSDSINEVNIEPVLADQKIGALLKRTRETYGYRLEDVANITRISLQSLNNIETDHFSAFTNKTFLRGYLRGYAKFLKLDPEPIVAQYQKEFNAPQILENLDQFHFNESADDNERIVKDSQHLNLFQQRNFSPVLMIIILLLGIITFAFFGLSSFLKKNNSNQQQSFILPHTSTGNNKIPQKEADQPSQTNDFEQIVPEEINRMNDLAVPDEQLDPMTEDPSNTSLNQLFPTPSDSPKAHQAEIDKTTTHLSFTFNKPSWLQIKDKNDEIIIENTYNAGYHVTITVDQFVTVTLGNGAGVLLSIDEKPYDFSQHIQKRSQVARFSLYPKDL